MNRRNHDTLQAMAARRRGLARLRAATVTVGAAGVVTAGVVAFTLPGGHSTSNSTATGSGSSTSGSSSTSAGSSDNSGSSDDSGTSNSTSNSASSQASSAPAASSGSTQVTSGGS